MLAQGVWAEFNMATNPRLVSLQSALEVQESGITPMLDGCAAGTQVISR
jgi:hypothetical protein